MKMVNKDKRISRAGFACGYVDASFGFGTRIEKHASGSGLLARADCGHSILYSGPSLVAARDACWRYVKLRKRYASNGYHCESQGVGVEYVARVRLHGVIIGVGNTLAAAMEAASVYGEAQR